MVFFFDCPDQTDYFDNLDFLTISIFDSVNPNFSIIIGILSSLLYENMLMIWECSDRWAGENYIFARVKNCPAITISNSIFVLCLFIFSSVCLFFCVSVCLFVVLSHSLSVFFPFASEGCQVTIVTLCVQIALFSKILKDHWSLTKNRYTVQSCLGSYNHIVDMVSKGSKSDQSGFKRTEEFKWFKMSQKKERQVYNIHLCLPPSPLE